VVLFLIALAIVMPEYEFPDEYHHITSTLDPGRHIDDPDMDKDAWYSYWYMYHRIFSYVKGDFEYHDPFLRIKERNFDSTSIYVQTKKNTASVVQLRVLQIVITIVSVFVVAYLVLDSDQFNSFVSLLVIYMSWPIVTHSLIGFNPAALLVAFIPLVITLLISKKYLLALLVSYGCYLLDNQGSLLIIVVLLTYGLVLYTSRKKQLYIYATSNRKYFVILLLLLLLFLHTYSIQIFGVIDRLSGVWLSQVTYLKRDIFTTGVIFAFTSLHYNGSLTSFNYYPVYVGYAYLMYKSIGSCINKRYMRVDFYYILSSSILFAIFVLFLGDLVNFRYHLYIVPIMVSTIVFYLDDKGISADYIVYAGLLVSAIGLYKFTSESYGLI